MPHELVRYVEASRLLSDQITKSELLMLLQELDEVQEAGVLGDVVEFGCYVGTTSVHLQRRLSGDRRLWLYDSFEGLPTKRTEDESPAGEQFVAGELQASKAQLIKNFKSQGLPLPVIKKAWFSQLAPNDVPQRIAFAFLDGDYYDSITDPLRLIWPRLSPGAVVIVDDYQNEALPGAQRAVDGWLRSHTAKLRVQASCAVIRVLKK